MQLNVDDKVYLRHFLDGVRELDAFYPMELVEPKTQGHLGTTPLHVAAIRGDCRAITLLAQAGADMDARGEHGFAPLHEAAQQGNAEAVLSLLRLGSSPAATTDEGDTAAALAFLTNPSKRAKEIVAIITKFSEP